MPEAGSALREPMVEYGVSTSASSPEVASRTASRKTPRSTGAQTIRVGDRNAYEDIPKTHCGNPNSASTGQSGSAAPPSVPAR